MKNLENENKFGPGVLPDNSDEETKPAYRRENELEILDNNPHLSGEPATEGKEEADYGDSLWFNFFFPEQNE